jgi:putative ABC transport system ATP-binding protein
MIAPESSLPAEFASSQIREPSAAALWLRSLNHRFGGGDVSQQVLFDIDLTIRPGELVILTGPSGCGKTTLLTLIGALRSVQEGTAQVLGRELLGRGKKELIAARRDIGFIFQAHNLLEALTAADNVAMALRLKNYTAESLHDHAARLLRIVRNESAATNPLAGVPRRMEAAARALVAGLLTHLHLGERIGHKPNQLSGGQKQRVAVARAIINHPRLILADEPTAALDKVSSAIVVDLLKKLSQHGSTILVVTHDNTIMDRGDRVVTMKDGRIVSNILVDETVRICFFLHKVSLFSALPPSHLVEVAAKVRKEKYQSGEQIIRQGEVAHKFYMIKEGQVDVHREEGGASVALATLGAGQFFGETALIEDKPRNATVTSSDRVELYALEKADFLRAHDAFESMRCELLKVFAQRFPGT